MLQNMTLRLHTIIRCASCSGVSWLKRLSQKTKCERSIQLFSSLVVVKWHIGILGVGGRCCWGLILNVAHLASPEGKKGQPRQITDQDSVMDRLVAILSVLGL